jgi:succinate dehydrogenase/fumarate reductase flavoprotein subunit
LVFGARAAIAMQEPLRAAVQKPDRKEAGGWRLRAGESEEPARFSSEPLDSSRQSLVSSPRPDDRARSTAVVREVMWQSAGLFRARDGLQDAVARLDEAYAAERIRMPADASDDDWWRHFNLLTVARLIARAALGREESRGGHFREDFPERDDRRWKFHAVVTRGD